MRSPWIEYVELRLSGLAKLGRLRAEDSHKLQGDADDGMG